MTLEEQVTVVLYTTKDPLNKIGVHDIPAMTTMLYRVCGNDSGKFDEAMRLVELFIIEALNQANKP
jgi:hypothetical protein